MTTRIAATHYLASHQHEMEDRGYVIFNPHNKSLNELPFIIGFNNGGSGNWWSAQLIAEDGAGLGGHICSHEGYMRHDLGILDGTRADRHATFQRHYPNGYRMDFVGYNEVENDERLKKAFVLNAELRKKAEEALPQILERDAASVDSESEPKG